MKSCPKINYKQLNHFVFGDNRTDYLLGTHLKRFVGYSRNPEIRRAGASGGIITQCLVYLLESGRVNGAVVLKQGSPKPWLAEPIIATTKKQVVECSQSVYIPVDTNNILPQVNNFKGKLAFVGLPHQVAEMRRLQMEKHPAVEKIEYFLGPYFGTSIELDAVLSYLRSNGISSFNRIKELRYRDGEWPGYLRITFKDGRELKCPKFHYNYLIPFYVTLESLLSIDFTNELTDISVGDAWSPQFENKRQGFSILLARTKKGLSLLEQMKKNGLVILKPISRNDTVNMHAHMIDFKKRGSFIRIKWLKLLNKQIPEYDYHPKYIPMTRYATEMIICCIFLAGRTRLARWIIEKIPIGVTGNLFNILRKLWKSLSKSVKRKGLLEVKFEEL